MRERLAFGILIVLLIFLFAFTFAVLGKGEYEPGGGGPATDLLAAWPDLRPGRKPPRRARPQPVGHILGWPVSRPRRLRAHAP